MLGTFPASRLNKHPKFTPISWGMMANSGAFGSRQVIEVNKAVKVDNREGCGVELIDPV